MTRRALAGGRVRGVAWLAWWGAAPLAVRVLRTALRRGGRRLLAAKVAGFAAGSATEALRGGDPYASSSPAP